MILDTNAVSSLLEGELSLERQLAGSEGHHLPAIVIGEYLFGISQSTTRRRLESLFRQLIRESILLDVDQQTGEYYAHIRLELKQKGRPIPDNDIWIAALARQYNLSVISRDAHFDAVDGLDLLSW